MLDRILSPTSSIREIVTRVLWTFVQAAGAALLVTGFSNVDALKAAGVAGGLAALKLVVEFSRTQTEDGDAEPAS